jgi:hypothetical protein
MPFLFSSEYFYHIFILLLVNTTCIICATVNQRRDNECRDLTNPPPHCHPSSPSAVSNLTFHFLSETIFPHLLDYPSIRRHPTVQIVRDQLFMMGKYLQTKTLDNIEEILSKIWRERKGDECMHSSIVEVMDLFGHFRFQRIERNYTKSENIEFIRSLLGGTLRDRYKKTSEYRNTKLTSLE